MDFHAQGLRIMNRYSIIIQGEGKGHYSQAMAALELLEGEDYQLASVYLGRSIMRKSPAYFREYKKTRIIRFLSPNFIRTSDGKGIHVFASLFFNFLLIPVYLLETLRIAILMRKDQCNFILNFYDPVGSLSARWWRPKTRRLTISHHFYLSHPDFIHPHGLERSYFWLQFMNHLMHRQTGNALALSFRKGADHKKIKVIPPLIRQDVRQLKYTPGKRDLIYLLNPGFLEAFLDLYRRTPDCYADVFTGKNSELTVPENVTLYRPERKEFLKKMANCRRIISTAGFDLVAEAFYLGIPIYLLPTPNHYEQYCNAIDAARTGMAYHLDVPEEMEHVDFEPTNNKGFKAWAERSKAELLEAVFLPSSRTK